MTGYIICNCCRSPAGSIPRPNDWSSSSPKPSQRYSLHYCSSQNISLDPYASIHFQYHRLESLSEISCAHDYQEYLKNRYSKALSDTSIEGWHDEQNSKFIDITIEKIGYVQEDELDRSLRTSSKPGINYRRQYSAQTCSSIAEMFQFDDSSKRQLILIEGNAGTGKTTLSHKVCKEWASNNILRKFTHVVLIHLRDQEPNHLHSVEDLFAGTGIDKFLTCKELAKKDTVLFWLDGWGELHNSYKKNSLFTRLLAGIAFPCATVVVASRPSATISLKKYCTFTHKYKLKGFSEPQIKAFVDDYFSRLQRNKERPEFMQKLKSIRGLAQLAEVPLNLSILTKVFLDMRFKFPNTLTEIYNIIILVVLQYHKEKVDSFDDYTKPIIDLDDLPPKMLDILHGLEKHAFDRFLPDSLTPEEEILQYINLQGRHLKNFNGMGLLDVKKQSYHTGDFKCYLYRYRVFQEFLAAIYLTRFQKSVETEELRKIFGDMDYEMVWIFYAGITKLKRVKMQHLLPDLNRPLQPTLLIGPVNTHEELVENWQQCYTHFQSMKEHEENHMQFLFTLILCCYEAENPEACKHVANYYYSNDICHIEIQPNHAIPYFLLAISYFITHSGKKWSLRCDNVIPSGVEFLLKYRKEMPSAFQTENTGGLWVLCFVVTLSEVEWFIELIKLQPSLQWVRLLTGSYLGDDGIQKLCNFLAYDDCNIAKIELEHCGIKNFGLKSVTNLLNNNSKLLYINLRKNSFSSEGIKTLLHNIEQNTSLEYLIIDEFFCRDPEIIYILQAINTIRTEKKANTLSLIQDFLNE